MSAVRVFECLACGSDLRFDPGQLSVHCSICEDERPLPLRFASDVEGESIGGALSVDRLEGRLRFRCSSQGCGVLVSAPSPLTGCPCCGSALTDQTELPALMRAHGYLPFLCSRQDAEFRLSSELHRLKLPVGTQRLQQVYVPWVVLACEGRGTYTGRCGIEHSDDNSSWIVWHDVAGRVERPFENIRACGTSAPPEELCRRLEPWDWAFCEPLNEDSLGEIPVAHCTWARDELFSRLATDMAHSLETEAMYDIGGDVQEVHSVDVERLDERYRLVLMPVWIGALTHLHTYFLINGRTGEVVLRGYEGTDPTDFQPDEPEVTALRLRDTLQKIGTVAVGVAIVAWVVWSVLM